MAAYAVILIGGTLITRRLLLALAATFWVALAAGLGLLAASGHCMTANWAFAPVCGVDYWRVVVTSPEVLIFLFFMITDPKTVPVGQVGRVMFGLLVAIACVLLMAPQTDEWWTKVGLLSGLVLVCAIRPLLDRAVPEPKSAADDLRTFAFALALSERRSPSARSSSWAPGSCSPARLRVGSSSAIRPIAQRSADRHRPGDAPGDHRLGRRGLLDHELAGPGMQAVLMTLAENLELENEALRRDDASILAAVDHGDRLDEMRGRLETARAAGPVMTHYLFESIDVSLLVPFGQQPA